jgi:hypothetical protein
MAKTFRLNGETNLFIEKKQIKERTNIFISFLFCFLHLFFVMGLLVLFVFTSKKKKSVQIWQLDSAHLHAKPTSMRCRWVGESQIGDRSATDCSEFALPDEHLQRLEDGHVVVCIEAIRQRIRECDGPDLDVDSMYLQESSATSGDGRSQIFGPRGGGVVHIPQYLLSCKSDVVFLVHGEPDTTASPTLPVPASSDNEPITPAHKRQRCKDADPPITGPCGGLPPGEGGRPRRQVGQARGRAVGADSDVMPGLTEMSDSSDSEGESDAEDGEATAATPTAVPNPGTPSVCSLNSAASAEPAQDMRISVAAEPLHKVLTAIQYQYRPGCTKVMLGTAPQRAEQDCVYVSYLSPNYSPGQSHCIANEHLVGGCE